MKKYKHKGTITYEGQRYWVYADSKVDLAAKKALKLRDLQEGKTAVSSSMPTIKWIEYFIETYKTNQNERTRKTYVNRVKHNITAQI